MKSSSPKHLAVIGAGQIGSRHLQALAKIDLPVVLEVLDPNPEALTLSGARFAQIPENGNIQRIRHFRHMKDLSSVLDLAVVATNSDVRLAVVSELLRTRMVRSLILEKVVFQSQAAFEQAAGLFRSHHVSVWVNCFRRCVPIYHELKKIFAKEKSLHLRVSGCNWGLACNAIHFIDLLSYLTGDEDYDLDVSGLDSQIHQSRRKGFLECSGTLKATFSRGHELVLEERFEPGKARSFLLVFSVEGREITVNDFDGRMTLINKESKTHEEKLFDRPFQSNLTQLVTQEIFNEGTCPLTPFSSSYQLHLPLLEGLSAHFGRIRGKTFTFCPIT